MSRGTQAGHPIGPAKRGQIKSPKAAMGCSGSTIKVKDTASDSGALSLTPTDWLERLKLAADAHTLVLEWTASIGLAQMGDLKFVKDLFIAEVVGSLAPVPLSKLEHSLSELATEIHATNDSWPAWAPGGTVNLAVAPNDAPASSMPSTAPATKPFESAEETLVPPKTTRDESVQETLVPPADDGELQQLLREEVSNAQDAEDADPREVLRAELSAMKLTQLFVRAAAAGATEGEVEAAEDSDDFKSAVTELIIAKEVTLRDDQHSQGANPSEVLRAELSAMKLTQVFIRAAIAGATRAELEAAEDAADFKSAIIELLVASDRTWADSLISNSLPSTSLDKAAIVDKLRTGSKIDRQHAYQRIKQAITRKDVEVLCACVAPLLEVMSMDASEVQATEFQHVGVLLGKMLAVDVFALAPEFFVDDRWWRPCESKSSTLGIALAKPISELNETDGRTLSCLFSWHSAMCTKGLPALWHHDHSFTDRDLASFEFHFVVEGWMGVVPTSRASYPDGYSARNMKFSTLIMDLLRGSKVSDEYERAGMWIALLLCNFGMHDVGKHQVDKGIHALAMAELKTTPTINWVSSSKDPAGLFGGVWSAAQQATLPSPHLSDTESTNLLYKSGLLQAAMSEVKAAEVLGDNDDLSVSSVYFGILAILLNLDSSVPEAKRLVREGAGSLRWVMELEKPINAIESWACTSKGLMPMVCASFFGRDESGGPFNFSDEEMDAVLAFAVDSLRGNLVNIHSIQPMWTSVPCLACSVSDTNKDKMLRNPAWIEHLVDGLMLDPSHPRNQDDQPTGPNDPITAGRVQREYAEALAQFAVYEPGPPPLSTLLVCTRAPN